MRERIRSVDLVREGKNNDAEAFPVLNRFAYRETHTNTDSNRGALHVTYLFDTLGDSAPGGEFESAERSRMGAGRSQVQVPSYGHITQPPTRNTVRVGVPSG